MKTLQSCIYIFSFLLFNLALLNAQIPRTLSYQGVLADTSGTPRADADYNFTFSLYDSGSGGTLLWTEAKLLSIKRGLFSTALGDATPFPDSLKFDRPYWLNISVSDIGELTPRIPLTSVGYSMNALRADTAKVVLTNHSGDIWQSSDENIYVVNKKVGIGTSSPNNQLHIKDSNFVGINIDNINSAYNKQIRFMTNGVLRWYLGTSGTESSNETGSNLLISRRDDDGVNLGTALSIERSSGNVGIGTAAPKSMLHIAARGSSWGNPRFLIENTNLGTDQVALGFRSEGIYDWEFGAIHDGRLVLRDHLSKKSILTVYPGSSSRVVVDGRTVTDILEITGGSDLAEPFPVSEENQLEEGSVVVIDESNPGHVTLSTEPYDKKVAGVVSGAGGIKPGLTLRQEGLMEGDQNIALSGRVYVKATASNGSIKPGDRLVTSSTPGLCMKATDPSRCDGAVIGKAMSALETGEGLVLVLVNLQ